MDFERERSRELTGGVSVDWTEIASLHDAVRLRFVLDIVQNLAGLGVVFGSVTRFTREFQIARQQVMALGKQSPQAQASRFC